MARSRAAAALREIRDYYTWPRIAIATLGVYEQVMEEWQNCDWGKEYPSL
jgi:hypothetical protein